EVIASVTWPVLRPHSRMRTGSAVAIRSWSKASKKVTTPMKVRTFTCQREVGSRSSRAAIDATVGGFDTTVIRAPILPGHSRIARPGGPGEVDVIHRTPPQPETVRLRILRVNDSWAS